MFTARSRHRKTVSWQSFSIRAEGSGSRRFARRDEPWGNQRCESSPGEIGRCRSPERLNDPSGFGLCMYELQLALVHSLRPGQNDPYIRVAAVYRMVWCLDTSCEDSPGSPWALLETLCGREGYSLPVSSKRLSCFTDPLGSAARLPGMRYTQALLMRLRMAITRLSKLPKNALVVN